MVVYECKVTKRADGTVEVEPIIESAHVEAKRRIADATALTDSAESVS